MRIETPNPDPAGGPIIKEIVVGGGVRIRLEGTRYASEATVLSINEEEGLASVRGVGFTAVVNGAAILDATSPEDRTYQEIFENHIDVKDELTNFDSIAQGT